jgi:hypothetical protein
MRKAKEIKPTAYEIMNDMLNFFKIVVTYQQLDQEIKEGILDEAQGDNFKKHFDPIAEKVADRIEKHYKDTLKKGV